MDSWAPATEAEAAMRDVLRAGDQEHYFRILARLDLLLPVSADSAGRRSPGWGTWSSDGRTHVLAFTSIHAMRACLAEHAGNYRLAQFRELAEQWPNPEWWLAINPGLPIEGYLPAWFVAQISRGDVRLPGRAMGSRARMEHANNLRARAVAQVPRRMPPAPPVPAGGGRVPPGRRPPGAGIVLSGEIVEATPVDAPVSPAAPVEPVRPAAQPAQPAARTVTPGIPGVSIPTGPPRQPGAMPPGRERPAEPFPSSPAPFPSSPAPFPSSPAPAPGAVPVGSPVPAGTAAGGPPVPAGPTAPPRSGRPERSDRNGRADGVEPPAGYPARPDQQRPSLFDRSDYSAFERPDFRGRPGVDHPRRDRGAEGERPDQFERPEGFDRGEPGPRQGPFEGPVGPDRDRPGGFERPDYPGRPMPSGMPDSELFKRPEPGPSQPFDRSDFRDRPAYGDRPAAFPERGGRPAPPDRAPESERPPAPQERGREPGFAPDRPGEAAFAPDRPGGAGFPPDRAGEAAFAPAPPDQSRDTGHPPVQPERPGDGDFAPPPDHRRGAGHPSQGQEHPVQPGGALPRRDGQRDPGYPPERGREPGYAPSQGAPRDGGHPAERPGEPGYAAQPAMPAAFAASGPSVAPTEVAPPGAVPPGYRAPDVGQGRPAPAPPGSTPPSSGAPGYGAPQPPFGSPGSPAAPSGEAPHQPTPFGPPGSPVAPTGGEQFGQVSSPPFGQSGSPVGPAAPPVSAAPGYAPPVSAAPGYGPPVSAAPGYAPSPGGVPDQIAAPPTYAAPEAPSAFGGPWSPAMPVDHEPAAYQPPDLPPYEEPTAGAYRPAGADVDGEPSLGLGARLAALQAQSGGFAVIPVDQDDSDLDDHTDGRGMWEPKVPPAPAEPDEEPTPYPEPEQADFAPLTPSSGESVSDGRTSSREPEPEQFDYDAYPPANDTERELLEAHRNGTADRVLSTLLLAKVLIPGYSPDPGSWPVEEIDGGRYLVAFTSMERLVARSEATPPEPPSLRFTTVIARWPSDEIGFALNPGTPMGKLLAGSEVRGLARSAAEFGLIDAEGEESDATQLVAPPKPAARPAHSTPPEGQPQLMQRTIAAAQVSMYLERGYDRVCGFVHRASELSHLSKPIELYRALGLLYSGSPFRSDDAEVYVLRWPAHLLGLYRIPFGGQGEEAMHAMQGWMIERAPFRGNGFAPSESSDVVAEFKIDSTRLPHGAQLWRLNSEGIETLVALFDADGTRWRKIGSADA